MNRTQVIADMDPIKCRRLIKSKLLFAKQQNLRLDSARRRVKGIPTKLSKIVKHTLKNPDRR